MAKKLKKNFNMFFLPLLLVLSACAGNNSVINQPISISKEVSVNKGFNVLLKIKPTLAFASKADSSSGARPKTVADIKSYSAFLTNNSADPFASGANPHGDNVYVSENSTEGEITLSFSDVPNGTYTAMVAAFDGTVGSERDNITKADPDIPTEDKQWASSDNEVIVHSGELVYTGDSDSLTATLRLLEPIPAKVGSTINVGNGSSNTVGDVQVN